MEDTQQELCPICYENITPDTRYNTPCGHTFHKECFDQLAEVNKKSKLKCPVCSKVLKSPLFDEELIQKEIEDYISEWESLNCDDLIEQIKLIYEKTFDIDENLIINICNKYKTGGRSKKNRKRKTKKRTKKNKRRKHKSHRKKVFKNK